MEDIKKRNKEHSSGAFQIEVQNLGGVWHYEKHHGSLPCGRGREAPEESGGRLEQCKKEENIRPPP